jgi:hypothetical protein
MKKLLILFTLIQHFASLSLFSQTNEPDLEMVVIFDGLWVSKTDSFLNAIEPANLESMSVYKDTVDKLPYNVPKGCGLLVVETKSTFNVGLKKIMPLLTKYIEEYPFCEIQLDNKLLINTRQKFESLNALLPENIKTVSFYKPNQKTEDCTPAPDDGLLVITTKIKKQ